MRRKSVFVAVGDVIPTRQLPPGWRPFGDADFVFADLEAPLTNRGTPWDKPVCYCSDPDLAHQLGRAGFGLVSLANNQAMNYGRTGLTDTFRALDDAGLPYIGAGPDMAAALAPHVFDIGDTKIAMVALTCVAPRHWGAGAENSGMAVLRPRQSLEVDPAWAAEEPGVAPTVHTWLEPDDIATATKAVKTARGMADIAVATVHWGVGTNPEVVGYQRQLGRALVDAGAALVLGSHPPPLQGFEQSSAGLISYSLGTFIRQQPQQGVGEKLEAIYAKMPRQTAVLRVKVDQGRFIEALIQPAVLDSEGLAQPVTGDRARRIIRTILDRSTGLDIGDKPALGHEPETLLLNLA